MKSTSLFDPKYIGGLDGASGYRFEDAYILGQLPSWLSLPNLEAFQQEGWSDVELFFESGHRWLIQIKNHRIKLDELREIFEDFETQETEDPLQYERYIIASTGLTGPGEQIRRYLERFRTVNRYSEAELAATRVQLMLRLEQYKLGNHASLIIEKVYFESDIAGLKDAEKLQAMFIGLLANKQKISTETANDIFLRTARLLTVERGKPIELSLIREAVKQKQLEDRADALVGFELITSNFLARYLEGGSESFFYEGAVPTWSDIVHQRDIPRDIMQQILSQVRSWKAGRLLVPILAEAGEGKSTLLRRMAKELAGDNKVVLYHRHDTQIGNAREVGLAAEIAGRCVYVFIDDASRVQDFSGFIRSISELPYPIVVITASRPYEWAPLRAAYSANIELGFDTSGREYLLEGLTDHEMQLLFQRLAAEGLIRPLSDADLRLAIDFHGKRSKRKLLALVLELVQGKKVREVIRDEIERVRKMGEHTLRVYQYTCLMGSVGSFITLPILRKLIGDHNVDPDVMRRLPGLVKIIGERLYSRHDRIAEIATDLIFEGADGQRGDLLCQLISLALEHGHVDMVRAMAFQHRSVPQSQLLKVTAHLVDEAYCAGEFDLIHLIIERLQWDNANEEIFRELLAVKTPLIWEKIVFPLREHAVDWNQLQKATNIYFSRPSCIGTMKKPPDAHPSVEIGLQWADLYSWVARRIRKYYSFFRLITDEMYKRLSTLYPDKATEINLHYAQFLSDDGREAEAINLYNTMLEEKEPNNADVHAGLALTLYLVEDYAGALHHYRVARKLDRDSVFRYDIGILGEMLEMLGELEEFIEYQKDSLKQHFAIMRRLQAALGPALQRGVENLRIPKTPEEEREREYETWPTEDLSKEAEQAAITNWTLANFMGLGAPTTNY
jgi:tetratricopeptide (TPR) repeat protein